MFQFPSNPLVGQIFTPIPGVQYKWNGTGWMPFATGILTKPDTDLLYIPLTQRAAPLGVATLEADGKIPLAQGNWPTLAQVLAIFVGSIMWRHSVGAGMLLANGQTVAKASYPELWSYAQGFLTANQATHPGLYRDVNVNEFALPVLDGRFIRAMGGSALGLGQAQADETKSHTHAITDPGHGHSISPHATARLSINNVTANWAGNGGEGAQGPVSSATSNTTGISIQAAGGAESRPMNVALLPCIITGRYP